MTLPQVYETEVIKAERFNENTIFLELKFEAGVDFKFKAGQFIYIHIVVDGKEEERPYSIASKPSQDTIELLIRKYDEGKVSPYLYKLNKGDKLRVRGPIGIFKVKKPVKKETVFIAAGAGVAPLRSMIYDILENFPNKKVTLIFGFRYETDFFFKNEFKKLAEKNKNFKCYGCATKAKGESYLKGRVTEHLSELVGFLENKDVYICGPSVMIDEVAKILTKELGFKKDRVYFEEWELPE
ncbi:MAG: FAD-dependent oxidoreductase [Candidatus Woesearchaeota archaeon]